MRLLVVNAGSSSLKVSVLDGDEVVVARHVERWDGADDGPIGALVAEAGRVDVAAHRVVHGGTEFTAATVLDERIVARLGVLSQLAPLHQPRALAAVAAARAALPDVPHGACFDTAFHASMPEAASTYALPEAWRARWPLRRFGFHGLSHAYAARRAAELCGLPPEETRVVTCHLGAGASLCAVRGGRSLDTTMGFTPLDGLVMATRSGAVDPGLVLWLVRAGGLDPATVSDALEQGSGLLGLAGTADLREVVARRDTGDSRAALAFDVYTHRLRRELGAMRAALDRVDVYAFTGGVGEHAPAVRAAGGLALDGAANARVTADGDIGAPGVTPRVVVVTAREDLEIAREVRACLG